MGHGRLTETIGRHKMKVEKWTYGIYGGGCVDIAVDNGLMNKEIDKEKVEKWAPGRSCWRLIQPVL